MLRHVYLVLGSWVQMILAHNIHFVLPPNAHFLTLAPTWYFTREGYLAEYLGPITFMLGPEYRYYTAQYQHRILRVKVNEFILARLTPATDIVIPVPPRIICSFFIDLCSTPRVAVVNLALIVQLNIFKWRRKR